jgi:hypothetical protein
MAVTAKEIGGNHQFTDVTRIVAWQAAFGQRIRDETHKGVASDLQIVFFIHRCDASRPPLPAMSAIMTKPAR